MTPTRYRPGDLAGLLSDERHIVICVCTDMSTRYCATVHYAESGMATDQYSWDDPDGFFRVSETS